jgi:hypothetical protein
MATANRQLNGLKILHLSVGFRTVIKGCRKSLTGSILSAMIPELDIGL